MERELANIVGVYYGMVLIFGLVALAIGIPLGVAVGRGYAAFTAAMLNFDITSNIVLHWTYAVQILVGLSIPLLAASVPIYKEGWTSQDWLRTGYVWSVRKRNQ